MKNFDYEDYINTAVIICTENAIQAVRSNDQKQFDHAVDALKKMAGLPPTTNEVAFAILKPAITFIDESLTDKKK